MSSCNTENRECGASGFLQFPEHVQREIQCDCVLKLTEEITRVSAVYIFCALKCWVSILV